MAIISINTQFKEKPVLLDRVLQEIRQKIKKRLAWLDYAFGRAYKVIKYLPDGQKYIEPTFYNGSSEYVSLLPNDQFGNFMWFDIYDPQKISTDVLARPRVITEGAIVFWYNLQNIYADTTFLYTEEIKNEILKALTSPGLITSKGSFELVALYENPENVYQGYSIEKLYNDSSYFGESLQEHDKLYFMYPYAGLRIEFKLNTLELC